MSPADLFFPLKFAIRPSIRSHNTLKRADVIARIADLVDTQHKVDLGNPDKVILVDIYQVWLKFLSSFSGKY